MSKNSITIEQIRITASCMEQLLESGMTENLAIRHLEKLVDVYAKFKIIGKVSVDHVDEFSLWSKAALKAKEDNLDKKAGEYLRVEHGTPRRKFARLVLDAFKEGKLNKIWMDNHCSELWKVAVITHEEDSRLNKIKTREFETPDARWASVSIEF